MFKNIGKKIKLLAKILCWLQIIAYMATAVFFMVMDQILLGFVILVVGFLVAWIGSFLLYGFGELVDNSTIQTKMMLKWERQNKPTYVSRMRDQA